MNMYHCPICHSEKTLLLYSCQNLPTTNNILCSSLEEAMAVPVSSVEYHLCKTCFHLWNADYNPQMISFNNRYNNNQMYSSIFKEHLSRVHELLFRALSLSNGKVLEVGCGQGDFLENFAARMGKDFPGGLGCDPALVHNRCTGNLNFFSGFFDEDWASHFVGSPVVLLMRHLLQHVKEPVPFLNSILNATHSVTNIILEISCCEYILNNVVLWDLYPEQCHLYSFSSIEKLLMSIGFKIDVCEYALDGQYIILSASRNSLPNLYGIPKQIKNEQIEKFQSLAKNFIPRLQRNISTYTSLNLKLGLWGAASKGVIFNALASEGVKSPFVAAIDLNPEKRHKFLPCSCLKIIAPEEIPEYGIDTAFVMNSSYMNECRRLTADFASKICCYPAQELFLSET